MTSDAKIGLLLGLVFIFIIAFVVNGLPRLRAEPDSNELTIISAENVVSSENSSPGLGARERGAEGVFETWTPQEAAGENESPQQPSAGGPAQPQTDMASAEQDDGVRYQRSLPGGLPASTDELLSFGSGGVSIESNWLAQGQRPRSTDGGGLLANFLGRRVPDHEPAPAVVSPPQSRESRTPGEMGVQEAARVSLSEQEQTVAPLVVEPESPRPEPQKITTPKRPRRTSQWPKEYVVSTGDNLAVIAKKFYGDEEGNRRVNIDLIFKANEGTLKSPDMVKIGQKLRIPALPNTPKAPEQASIFPKSLVERVKSIGLRKVPAGKVMSAEKVTPASGRYYVAKEGDSLWKIAADQLGKGSRYVEIFTLNNDIMKDATNVVPGMRLRMPAN